MPRNRPDRRYTLRLEFCGYATARYVVRFCGEWVGQAATKAEASELRNTFESGRWAVK